MSERREVVIRASVTQAQALALTLMLETWNRLASIGSSRFVAFYADGDGNFHPKATIEMPAEFGVLNDEMRKAALKVTSEQMRELHAIDFDPIAWMLHN